MKIKQIASLCSKAKTLALYDDGRRQWLGDGVGIYLLPESLPELDTGSACTLMDIQMKKAADWYVRRSDFPQKYDPADVNAGEELNWSECNRAIVEGKDMLPLLGRAGTYFIQTKYIKPITDSEALQLKLKYTDDDIPYIAAMDGVFLAAVIMPVRIKDTEREWLGQIYSGAVRLTEWAPEE